MEIIYPTEKWDKEISIRRGACLPHWTKEGAVYHVCFRLHDSVPQSVLESWKDEREEIINNAAKQGRKLTLGEQQRIDFLFSEKVERYLDAGHGECWLKRDDAAELMANALCHSEGKRYRLHAWCVMPNHVHVVPQPLPGNDLHEIVRIWKSYTARFANKILKRSGDFWQEEYFDHLIRNPESLEQTIDYMWNNPDEAGLKNWQWRWRSSELAHSKGL